MTTDLPAAMSALIAGVTRVRVIDGGVAGGQACGEAVLCDLAGDDAAGLLARLAVGQPAAAWHCMCLGDPAIELWAGARRRATIGLHHGQSVRVHGWWSDAPLRDGEALLRWLAERGAPGPLARWQADRAARSEGERRRGRWLAATPAALRPWLGRLEGEGQRLPRFLKAGDEDVAEALAVVRAACGANTAAVLLGWFGGPGGPWSGYPAYEAVAEVLLACVPIAEVIAAAGEDEAVLLGLARFLARHGAPPRERRSVGEELKARLVALVRRVGDADMQARLAAALEEGAPRTRDGARIGDAELETTLGPAVACGEAWATLDGASVVRFDPGRTQGTVLAALPAAVAADLAVVEDDLVVTLSQSGEVWRVPRRGCAARVVARGQARPTAPAGLRGKAAWLEQEALPGHRTATRVRLEGAERALAGHAGSAWDLIACGGALWWGRHGGSWWSTLFGKHIHRVDLLRWDPDTGRVETIRVLEGGDDGTSVPRLFTDGERIAWTSGRKIGVVHGSGEPRWFAVDEEILAALPFGEGVLVALARGHDGELVLLADGGRRVLARWRRALWERERLAVRGRQVVWNAGEHLWAVDL